MFLSVVAPHFKKNSYRNGLHAKDTSISCETLPCRFQFWPCGSINPHELLPFCKRCPRLTQRMWFAGPENFCMIRASRALLCPVARLSPKPPSGAARLTGKATVGLAGRHLGIALVSCNQPAFLALPCCAGRRVLSARRGDRGLSHRRLSDVIRDDGLWTYNKRHCSEFL